MEHGKMPEQEHPTTEEGTAEGSRERRPGQFAFPMLAELYKETLESQRVIDVEAYLASIRLYYRQQAFHFHLGRSLSQDISDARIVERLEDLEKRQDLQETQMRHGVQPAIGRLSKAFEYLVGHEEKDAAPPAASAEYEWQSEAKKVLKAVEDMTRDFDDLSTRLSHHVAVIERIRELLKLARSMTNRSLRSAVLTVHDALCSIYSENLTLAQTEAAKEAVQRLQNLNWDREMVRALDRTLRDHGFETVPSDKFVDLSHAQRNS